MPEYTIYIGADHRGYNDKKELKPLLEACHGFVKVEDLGADEFLPEDDFNDYANRVVEKVLSNPHSFGVLICGSGDGVCMQANRHKGIRAISAKDELGAISGREDEDANIICLSGDGMNAVEMEKIVKVFCHTQPKTDEKYIRRIEKLDK